MKNSREEQEKKKPMRIINLRGTGEKEKRNTYRELSKNWPFRSQYDLPIKNHHDSHGSWQ